MEIIVNHLTMGLLVASLPIGLIIYYLLNKKGILLSHMGAK